MHKAISLSRSESAVPETPEPQRVRFHKGRAAHSPDGGVARVAARGRRRPRGLRHREAAAPRVNGSIERAVSSRLQYLVGTSRELHG